MKYISSSDFLLASNFLSHLLASSPRFSNGPSYVTNWCVLSSFLLFSFSFHHDDHVHSRRLYLVNVRSVWIISSFWALARQPPFVFHTICQLFFYTTALYLSKSDISYKPSSAAFQLHSKIVPCPDFCGSSYIPELTFGSIWSDIKRRINISQYSQTASSCYTFLTTFFLWNDSWLSPQEP